MFASKSNNLDEILSLDIELSEYIVGTNCRCSIRRLKHYSSMANSIIGRRAEEASSEAGHLSAAGVQLGLGGSLWARAPSCISHFGL